MTAFALDVEIEIVVESDSDRQLVPVDGLFVVWFNVGAIPGPPDWWWEEPGPQPLSAALDLAAQMRRDGWICIVVPDGQNPRPDGRWDNPP